MIDRILSFIDRLIGPLETSEPPPTFVAECVQCHSKLPDRKQADVGFCSATCVAAWESNPKCVQCGGLLSEPGFCSPGCLDAWERWPWRKLTTAEYKQARRVVEGYRGRYPQH